MPTDKPQTRFLLRGSVLLISLLLLWWFFLVNPLLFLLRGALEASGSVLYGGAARELVSEAPSGDWSFRVPIEILLPPSPQQPTGAQVQSIEFDMPRSDVTAFTFSLPVYWAIILAAPGIRRAMRPLILGTVLVAILEIVLVVWFVEISAHKVAAQLYAPQSGTASWLLRFGEYLVVNVIPYAAPFLIAIALHRELRWQMLRWGSAEAAPAAEIPVSKPGTARGKQPRKPELGRPR
jgi:hypothetical protein